MSTHRVFEKFSKPESNSLKSIPIIYSPNNKTMSFETTGKLIEVYPVTAISDKFKKREFVIETAETKNGFDFKDFVKFQVTQDKCSLPDQAKIGDTVKVSFNLRGRKWEKDGLVNYFTNLEAWKLEIVGSKTPGIDNSGFPDVAQAPISDSKEFSASAEELDDLPF
jgi:hypothetical protein